MSNCTSGCVTKDHASYGDCLRSKGLRVAYSNSANGQDATTQKRWDASLERYRSAVRSGMQPESTTPQAVRAAESWSNRFGEAYTSGAAARKKADTLKELAS